MFWCCLPNAACRPLGSGEAWHFSCGPPSQVSTRQIELCVARPSVFTDIALQLQSCRKGHSSSTLILSRISFVSSPILHFLPPSLLELCLPLARSRTRLRYTSCILIPSPHPRIRRPRRISRVRRDNRPQPPSIIPNHRCQRNASITPVHDIPHVFRKALGVQIFACALHDAIFVESGSTEALEVELN